MANLNFNPDAAPTEPSADLIAWVEDAFASWKALRTENNINGAGELFLKVTQGLARALEAWGDRPLPLNHDDILDALTRLSTRQLLSEVDKARQKIIVSLTRNGRLWTEGEKSCPAKQLLAKAIETGELTMIECLLEAADAPSDLWTAPMFKLTGDINTAWREVLCASGNTPHSNRLTVTLPALAILIGQASNAPHVKDSVAELLARLPAKADMATSAGHPLLAVMGADALEVLDARPLDVSQAAPNGVLALSVALTGSEEKDTIALIQALGQRDEGRLAAHAPALMATLLQRLDHYKAGMSVDALLTSTQALAKISGKPLLDTVLPSGDRYMQGLVQHLVTHPNAEKGMRIRTRPTLILLGEDERTLATHLKAPDANGVPLASWMVVWAALENIDALHQEPPCPENMALWLVAGGEAARTGMQAILADGNTLRLEIALETGAAMVKMETLAPELLLAIESLRERTMQQIQSLAMGSVQGRNLAVMQARLMQSRTPESLTPREAAMELIITKVFGTTAPLQQQTLVEKIIEDEACRVETKQWLDNLVQANPKLLDNNPSLRALHMGLTWDSAPAATRSPRM